MTQSYWPFDGSDTTETQYSQLFRRLQMDGVWGDPGDNSLKLVQGTGMIPVLKSGYMFIRGHMYYNDGDEPITFPAADGTTRYDRLVLRLNPTANTITPVIIGGTPGAGDGAALVQTDAANYDVLVAQVRINGGGSTIVTADIEDRRSFAGMVWGSWTTATRPGTGVGTVAPRKGQPGYNSTTSKSEYWDGSGWVDLTISAITAAMISGPEQLLLSVGNSEKIDGHKLKVQMTAPSTPADKDLWVQTTS